MTKSHPLISAQAIVFNEWGKLILEDNKKIGKWSFIGWAFDINKWDREVIDTVIREIKEETTLVIDYTRLICPYIQPVTRFWTWLWKSTYFLLKLTYNESEKILSLPWFNAFETYPDNNFPISEKRFKAQVDRGRKYFNF